MDTTVAILYYHCIIYNYIIYIYIFIIYYCDIVSIFLRTNWKIKWKYLFLKIQKQSPPPG